MELEELGLKPLELATRLGVPNNRIYQILDSKRSITADTALRLGIFFSTSAEFWLNLQKAYELDLARRQIGDGLKVVQPYRVSKEIADSVASVTA